MEMNNRTIGKVLIAVGVLFALGAIGVIQSTIAALWPLVMLVPGAYMLMQFYGKYERGNPAWLIPGSILVVYGGLFLICGLFSYRLMGLLWPVFLLGPALGLFQFYMHTGRNPWLLIPVVALTVIGGIFLLGNALAGGAGIVFAVLLVAAGAYLLSGKNLKRNRPF